MKIDSSISGRWVTAEEDSDVELTIEFSDGVPTVLAHCRSDGEKLDVQDLRIEGDTLCFETIVPSTGYRARSRMRFLDMESCEMELTLRERWKRIE